MKIAIVAAIALPISLATTTLIAAPSLAVAATNNTDLSYATKVLEYNAGAGIQESFRTNTNNALGTPQADPSNNSNKNFLSLGLGGSAIFEFGGKFLPEVTLWETTWGGTAKRDQNYHNEKVEVFVGNDLKNWISLGIIENIDDGAYINPGGATIKAKDQNIATTLFQYLKLVDVSPTKATQTATEKATSGDGFDVNAVAVKTVQSVPEPGSILGLLAFGTLGVKLGLKPKKQAS
ncbi:hypothetical protein Nos7524_2413 [Nostoc sp. PCC 7524]|uniref:hypothetical protein n=1 Tax=Nostoc sp. (strain ATCC 29411 / PCC 7524) TaxID=28072 RepID=UPI00029EC39E|nr:hypothetical protein [Nostoc sp. PCC 7524]AFY48255.1 hypothetical protein Nos7524_2413 [Nostoc sp. PCC 7524]